MRISILAALLLAGCSSPPVYWVTDAPDMWVKTPAGNLYYCRANPTPNGFSAPQCMGASWAERDVVLPRSPLATPRNEVLAPSR
jgi:hypothetical protein